MQDQTDTESPQPVAEAESLVGVASTALFGWIPVSEQRPPLIEETPETKGFFLLLRHNPHRDSAGQYRMHLWFGSVPIDSTHWARIPSLPNAERIDPQKAGSMARPAAPLRSRLDALSDNAKEWLEKTCERFADGEGYDLDLEAIEECLAADLIAKRGRWIDVKSDVMGEVYSEGYFRQPDGKCEALREVARSVAGHIRKPYSAGEIAAIIESGDCSACYGLGGNGGDDVCSRCEGSGEEVADCPNCDNAGWYIVPDSNGEPTPEQ